jgi:predicted hydrolase (HD superfamily)
MIREEVIDSVKANVENDSPINHMLAAEAIMRALK